MTALKEKLVDAGVDVERTRLYTTVVATLRELAFNKGAAAVRLKMAGNKDSALLSAAWSLVVEIIARDIRNDDGRGQRAVAQSGQERNATPSSPESGEVGQMSDAPTGHTRVASSPPPNPEPSGQILIAREGQNSDAPARDRAHRPYQPPTPTQKVAYISGARHSARTLKKRLCERYRMIDGSDLLGIKLRELPFYYKGAANAALARTLYQRNQHLDQELTVAQAEQDRDALDALITSVEKEYPHV